MFLYNEQWHGVLQQYEGAIKSYRAGKPVDFEELPTPPGKILVGLLKSWILILHSSAE